MTGTPIVVTRGLTKRYGRTLALHDLDLEIVRGEVFGYLGPNGAGKTTTLRLLMGLLRPTAGSAQIDGLDTWAESVGVRRRVGYLSGEPALYGRMTGRQHVDFLGHLRKAPRPRRPQTASLSGSYWTSTARHRSCPRATGRSSRWCWR